MMSSLNNEVEIISLFSVSKPIINVTHLLIIVSLIELNYMKSSFFLSKEISETAL